MNNPAETVAAMTETQKEALLDCTPWDVCVGAGIAMAFCFYDILEDSTLIDDAVQLNAKGQAVRALLLENRE